MAAAAYTTNLAVLSEAETLTASPGTWAELSGHTSGGAATQEDRSYLQGSFCVSQSTGTATAQAAGLQYTHTSNVGTGWGTGWVFLAWQFFQAPKVLATWTNGGMRFGVGSSAGNMKYWNTQGSDAGRMPYGGWTNCAIDPTFTADQTDGTPVAGNYTVFGSMPNLLSAVSKGNPHCVDVLRYGRADIVITGGDLANGYGTCAGMAAANDADSARWGLFQYQAGSYLWKGLWSLGTTGTAVDFRDANRVIVIDDTPRAYAAFNKIEVNNAASRVDWTAFSISSLGTLSKGQFEMVANADVNLDSCTFTDMDTFVFQSNASIQSTIFRRCGLVTAGGAAFNGCTFDRASGAVAVSVSSLAALVDCSFASDGTGHAVDLGTVSASTSMTWACTDAGYATSNGSTGNETIKVSVAAGQTLTINVAAGKSTPTYYNTGAGTVSVVSGQVTLTLTGIVAGSEVRLYSAGTTTELDGIESASTSFAYTYTYAPGTAVDIVVHHIDYVYYRVPGYLLGAGDASLPIAQIADRNYLNPA